jgi:predicted nuclease with TOPRIM domain
MILGYSQYLKSRKIEEQESSTLMNIPAEFSSENDAINNLKNEIAAIEQDLVAKKIDLNKKVQELQAKVNTANQEAMAQAKQSADQAAAAAAREQEAAQRTAAQPNTVNTQSAI